MEPAKAEINPRYHFMSFEDATKPKAHIVYNIMNSWWCVHPEKGLAFWGKGYSHPQCNRDQSIAARLAPSWAVVVFYHQVFAPCNVGDYCE